MRLLPTTLLAGVLCLFLVATPTSAGADSASHPLEGSYSGDLGFPYANLVVEMRIDKHGKVTGKVDWIGPDVHTKMEARIVESNGEFTLELTLSYLESGEWLEFLVLTYLSVYADTDFLVLYDLYWTGGLVYVPRDDD